MIDITRNRNGDAIGGIPAESRWGDAPPVAPPSHRESILASRLNATDQLAVMRPTLLVFLGGTGVRLATYLKRLLIARLGYPLPPKIRLLVFDTTREAFSVPFGEDTVRLEEGAELFILSDVPVARIAENIDNQPDIRDRFGAVMAQLPPRTLRDGTKSNRCLGAVSLYWHFETVYEQLRRAVWRLAGRETGLAASADPQLGLNVFIGCGLGGGTGSGQFIDFAYLIRHLTDELGIQSEFCRLTGIGVLPQAFPGIPSRSLYPNTGAAFRELDHTMVHGNFRASYPGGRRIQMRRAPFDFYYVLDGVDERGRTWAGLDEVAAAGAQAVFMQMVSQLGRSGDNSFDNLDDVLAGRAANGFGTFMGSIGQGTLEFIAPEVARLCAHRLVVELIRRQWLADGVAAAPVVEARLQAVLPERLAATLMRDPQTNGEMSLDLHPPARLLETPHDRIAAETTHYIRRFGHSRLGDWLLGQMAANGETVIRAEEVAWSDWVEQILFAPNAGLPHVSAVLAEARASLSAYSAAAKLQLAEWEPRLERLEAGLEAAQRALAEAAGSLPIGRGGRVRLAVEATFKAAQALVEARRRHSLNRAQMSVWAGIDEALAALERLVTGLADRLATIAWQQDAAIDEEQARLAGSGIGRISLADSDYVSTLYHRFRPDSVALATLGAFSHPGAPASSLALAALPTADLSRVLIEALDEVFAPVRRMTIEQVVEERAGEFSAQALARLLFREATPLWSIDRTRLPAGGDRLVRLEILGVTDALHTAFSEEPTLVSTHDPHRVQAFVIVAGAPMTALQQYDRYQSALERVASEQPIHVLPAFMADADRGRRAFALGSIFGLIEAQGRYFYYRPADPLTESLLLGNGMAAAVDFLMRTQGTATAGEILERVDAHIAFIGRQEAITRLTDYVDAPVNDRSALGDLMRGLKRLVRDDLAELIAIRDLNEPGRRK